MNCESHGENCDTILWHKISEVLRKENEGHVKDSALPLGNKMLRGEAEPEKKTETLEIFICCGEVFARQ